MRKGFICNDKYNEEIFEKIWKLRGMPNWKAIDSFMGKEYSGLWFDYKEANSDGNSSWRTGHYLVIFDFYKVP